MSRNLNAKDATRNASRARAHRTFTSIIVLSFASIFLVLFSNCGSPKSASSSAAPVGASAGGVNVMPVTVGQGCGYVNEPCVTVTICVPGTSNCQTISNVLLDTGSYGLRLFSQVVTIPLTNVTDPSVSGNTLAECVSYADGSSDWGPLAKADIQLAANETASNVSIQIIKSTFATAPSTCTNMDTSPTDNQFNGILGVGLAIQDCGTACEASTTSSNANNGIYFTCTAAGSCKGSVVSGALQVSNPVASLPVDNNGVILQLPLLPGNQASQALGSLFFGIGTQSNNNIGSPTVFPADAYANFTTVFNGVTSNTSFIDSGSNMLFFADSAIAKCSSSLPDFYCPGSELTLSATQKGASGSASMNVSFNIGNANNELSASGVMAFSDLGMYTSSSDFDWGLPFFFGRTIYVGIEGKKSPLGTGPYWAY